MTNDQEESYELLHHFSSETEEYDRNARSGVAWRPSTLPRIFRKVGHLQELFLRKRRNYPIRCGELPRRIRRFRSAWKLFVVSFGFIIVISVLRAITFPSYQNPPAHYRALRDSVTGSTSPGRGNPYNEKIFIAANILQEDLIRGPWGESVLELIDLLGPGNVFLSIYENDSGPGTVSALNDLRSRVKCNSSIVIGGHLPLDGFPTVTLPSGAKRVKRIAYLAEVRNRALRPLDSQYDPSKEFILQDGFQHTSFTYDRILFINDIYFSPLSALHLLFSTNLDVSTGKPSYQAACAADFIGYAMFYDTFVVRDLEGYGMGLMFYPWFTPSGKAESRNDVLEGKDAVRVKSCWGGMIALEAAAFQESPTTSLDSSKLTAGSLRFRYEAEIYWESSECCLIHADMMTREPPVDETQDTGIYINPYVRVAYKPVTFSWIPFVTRYERFFAIFQYFVSLFFYPEYNSRRQDRPGELVTRRVWEYDYQDDGALLTGSGAFRDVEITAQPGGYCGQKRLFVMLDVKNDTNKGGEKNWEKIPVPPG